MISSIGRVINLSTFSGDEDIYGTFISTSSDEKFGRNANGNLSIDKNPSTIMLRISISMEIGLFTENSDIFINKVPFLNVLF